MIEPSILTTNHPAFQIRWMIRRDLPEVLRIESTTVYPWSHDQFLNYLTKRYCIGMVFESQNQICGFIIYELVGPRIIILKLGVCQNHRHTGVGTAIIEMMKRKLTQQVRHTIEARVRESDLMAQLFLKSQGFVVRSIMREEFTDPDEDAFQFEYIDL